MAKTNKVWLGLICITPKNENTVIGNNAGAWTNILLLQDSKSATKDKIREFLNENSFELVKIESLVQLETRLKKFIVANELMELAKIVQEKGTPECGSFHYFENW